MAKNRPYCSVPARVSTIVGELLWILVTTGAGMATGEAMAGEQPELPGDRAKVDFNAPGQRAPLPASLFALPSGYQPQALTVGKDLSEPEFRPLGSSATHQDSRVDEGNEAPMLRGTNIWQTLAEYRSRNSVRVLTLWETSGSSVSLQAGRKGTPTLQWTSRTMNRGGATRGILDRVLATSVGGFARGLHIAPHAGVGAEPKGKSGKVADPEFGDAKSK